MFLKNISGQFLSFSLVSAISGNAVINASGNISGRRTLDGGALGLLSGNIIEPGGGLYQANLFDFDTNANNIGFLFTASGCVPVTFTVITVGGVSGRVFPASGVNTVTPPATLSGVVANSGLFVNVPIASISGVVPNIISGITYIASGHNVVGTFSLGSGALSGQKIELFSGNVVNLLSGISFIASGHNAVVPPSTLSGVVANSGLFINVPIATLSGTVFASGGTVTVLIASISGVVPNIISGITYIASGHNVVGSFSLGSGALSGQKIELFSGNVVNLLSGVSFIASGHNAVVPPSTLSGVVANSGLFVNVPIATLSGTVFSSGGTVTVPIGSISGVVPNVLSGIVYPASGIFTVTSLASGTLFLASGQAVTALSGAVPNVLSGTIFPGSGVIAVLIPNAVLTRDFVNYSGVIMSGTSGRCLLQASRKLVNRWDVAVTNSGRLTVFQEDDSSVAYLQQVTEASGAAPISQLNTD